MKNKTFILGLATVGLFGSLVFSAFAAGVVLTNGGLGQVAGNTTSFGLAVCNGGTKAISQSVPVAVSANNQTVTISSAASIQPGACEYSYANYADLGMVAGQTYSVSVTINSTSQANYSVTVPSAQTAEATPAATNPQPTDFLGSIGAVFMNFFAAIKSLF